MPVRSAVRWYRGRGDIWMLAGLCSVAAVVLAGPLIAQGVMVRSDRTEIIVGVVVLLALCGLLISERRCGIGAGADHLIVRAVLRRQRLIPWPDIAGFELARPPRWRSGLAVIVMCHDGRRFYTSGCAFDSRRNASVTAGLQIAHALEAERHARTPVVAGGRKALPVPVTFSVGARRRQMTQRGAGKIAAGVLSVALMLWFGFIAVSGAVELGPALSASHGGGTKGYFLAQAESCGRSCSWRGEFRLPDGAVTRRGVTFYGDSSSLRAGSIVPALDTGDYAGVFSRNDSLQWIRPVIELVIGGALFTLLVLVLGRQWQRRRRRHRGTPGLSTPE